MRRVIITVLAVVLAIACCGNAVAGESSQAPVFDHTDDPRIKKLGGWFTYPKQENLLVVYCIRETPAHKKFQCVALIEDSLVLIDGVVPSA